MKINVKTTGPVSVKFSGRIWFISWNKTERKTLNESTTFDVGPTTFHKVANVGPLEVDLSTKVDGKKTFLVASLMLGGMVPLYQQEVDITKVVNGEPFEPWRIRVNNVRGVNADVTITVTTVS